MYRRMQRRRRFLSGFSVPLFLISVFALFLSSGFSVQAAANADIISGEVYHIINCGSGKYLNVSGNADANGKNINQWANDESVGERFRIVYYASEDCYRIHAMTSSNGYGRVLDIQRHGGAVTSGQNVQLWDNNDPTSQQL